MRYPRLYAILFFPVLLLILAEECTTEEKDKPVESTLEFTSSSNNTKTSDRVKADDPKRSYTAEVEITPEEDVLAPSDAEAYIIIDCQFSNDGSSKITLREKGLGLIGKGTATGERCIGPREQAESVSFYVQVIRKNPDVNFSVRVKASGG